MNDEDRMIMEYLILNGALEPAGVSETGEPLYNFTPKLKDVMPVLYKEHMNHVNAELMRLWEKGFITMNLFDENPVVRLAEKAFDQEEISRLSKDDQFAVNELKRIILK